MAECGHLPQILGTTSRFQNPHADLESWDINITLLYGKPDVTRAELIGVSVVFTVFLGSWVAGCVQGSQESDTDRNSDHLLATSHLPLACVSYRTVTLRTGMWLSCRVIFSSSPLSQPWF